MSIICVNLRRGLLWDKVRFRATEDHEATFGTLMGDKLFYMQKGEEITLRQSKDRMWEIGEEARSLAALITAHNQTQFNWEWKDGF